MSATATARALLLERLGVPVSTRKPEQLPSGGCVVLSRIGGGDEWAMVPVRFLVECFSTSELEAEDLAEDVARVWKGLRDPRLTYADHDKNVTRFDHPTPGQFRFQFTGTLTLVP
ncbi:MAG: hypothetical protein ACK4UY_03860 [Dietzia sp.]